MRMYRGLVWGLLSASTLAVSDARAELVSSCLGTGGGAISLAVDDRGVAHISRVFSGSGDLDYTVVDPIGDETFETVAAFISIVAADEVDETHLLLVDGVPHVCFFNARNDRLEVAFPSGGDDWTREIIAEGPRVGDACGLYVVDGALEVVFRNQGVLSAATRHGPDDWVVVEADGGGGDVGHQADVTVLDDGRVAVAHRDDANGNLRISFRGFDGRWRTEVADQVSRAGVRPRAVADDRGSLWVVHGRANPEASDGGLLLTFGEAGEWVTVTIDPLELGGATGAGLGPDGALNVMTRELRRHAVFGDYDGLRYYPTLAVDSGFVRLAGHDAAQQRVSYSDIDLDYDPFGMPVAALLRASSAFGGMRAQSQVCIWREADRDADRLPDVLEGRYRSDADDPDSDGDGVLDGDEVIDGTDPAGEGPLPDPLPADMGVVVEPDAGPVPDRGPVPDLGALPDVGPLPDDGVVESDFGVPMADSAVPDAAVPPDAEVPPDAAVPPDGEAPGDVGGGDMAPVADAAVEFDGALADGGAGGEGGGGGEGGEGGEGGGGAGGEGGAGATGGGGGGGLDGGPGDVSINPVPPSSDGCRAQPSGPGTGWGSAPLLGLIGLLVGWRRRRAGR